MVRESFELKDHEATRAGIWLDALSGSLPTSDGSDASRTGGEIVSTDRRKYQVAESIRTKRGILGPVLLGKTIAIVSDGIDLTCVLAPDGRSISVEIATDAGEGREVFDRVMDDMVAWNHTRAERAEQ